MRTPILCLAALLFFAMPTFAQWEGIRTPRVARTPDGKVKMDAPAPRRDGKPDLSGIWAPRPDPAGKPQGVENEVFPRYMINADADIAGPPDAAVHPSFKPVFLDRLKDDAADPVGHCKPTGAIRLMHLPLPLKIIQAPDVVLVLHEADTTYRQIFTDGRSLPRDPQPMFNGYSVGRWDGDVFVVDSTGFTDRAWLDAMGHPHSDALRVEERFRRVDTGHLEVAITFTDSKALVRPIKLTQHYTLLPDTDLFEYFCTENEKDIPHYVQTN